MLVSLILFETPSSKAFMLLSDIDFMSTYLGLVLSFGFISNDIKQGKWSEIRVARQQSCSFVEDLQICRIFGQSKSILFLQIL